MDGNHLALLLVVTGDVEVVFGQGHLLRLDDVQELNLHSLVGLLLVLDLVLLILVHDFDALVFVQFGKLGQLAAVKSGLDSGVQAFDVVGQVVVFFESFLEDLDGVLVDLGFSSGGEQLLVGLLLADLLDLFGFLFVPHEEAVDDLELLLAGLARLSAGEVGLIELGDGFIGLEVGRDFSLFGSNFPKH